MSTKHTNTWNLLFVFLTIFFQGEPIIVEVQTLLEKMLPITELCVNFEDRQVLLQDDNEEILMLYLPTLR